MTAWPSVRLQEVASIDRIGVKPSDIEDDTHYVGLEHIESGGRLLDVATVTNGDLASTKFRFTKNHLLYGKLRPYLTKIAMPHFDGICSTDILPILPGKTLDRSYITHFLRQPSMVNLATSRSTGASLPRLSPKALADFRIPLPPLAEQKRIAAILDQADHLRRLRQRAIDRLNDLGQSVFYEMFGDPSKNEKGFEITRLGEVCDVRDGTHDSPKYVEEGYPLLTSKNFSSGRLKYDGAKFISRADFDMINKRSKVDVGDIVMPMIGTIGSPVIIQEEPEFAIKNVALIKFKGIKIKAEYVRTLLSGEFLTRTIAKTSRGGTQKFISLGNLRALEFPLPPEDLQEDFCRRLTKAQSLSLVHDSSFSHFETLFFSLQQRAFRGEL